VNNKIAALANTATSANGRPTAPTYAVFSALSAQLDTQLVALRTTLATYLPKLNAMRRAAGRPDIVPRAVETPPAKKPAEITDARGSRSECPGRSPTSGCAVA
jgi:hypothetical protein